MLRVSHKNTKFSGMRCGRARLLICRSLRDSEIFARKKEGYILGEAPFVCAWVWVECLCLTLMRHFILKGIGKNGKWWYNKNKQYICTNFLKNNVLCSNYERVPLLSIRL